MYNTRAGESLQRDEEPCQLRAGSSGEKSSAAASEISGVCLSCSNTRKRESNDGPGSGIPTKNRPDRVTPTTVIRWRSKNTIFAESDTLSLKRSVTLARYSHRPLGS